MRLSFSRLNLKRSCELNYFFNYIQKAKPSDIVEEKYGVFGSVCHDAIENINKFKSIFEAVNHYWLKQSEVLETMKIQEAYDFVEFCVNYDFGSEILQNEMKLEWEFMGYKFVAYIDRVLKDHTVIDWKTSTYKPKKKIEYETQTLFYSWAYWKVFGIVPPQSIVVFGKAKKVFPKVPTLEILQEFEKEFEKELIELETKTKNNNFISIREKRNTIKLQEECFFCKYKKLCQINLNMKSVEKIILSYDYYNCKIEGCIDPVLFKVFNDEFSYTMDNAHFAIKTMRARGNKTFDGIIRLFKYNGVFPRGFLEKARELLQQYKAYRKDSNILIEEKNLQENFIFEEFNYIKNPDVKLRNYQNKANDEILKKDRTITEICTGAGKTFMAADMIFRKKMKTLFIVDVKMLMNQTKSEFEYFFPFEKIGVISEGKQNWENINVATIQTVVSLINKKDSEFLKNISECGIVIVDEAHSAKAKIRRKKIVTEDKTSIVIKESYYQILSDNCFPKHLIGLTGTAYSNGNDSLELYKTFGFPHHKITTKELIEEGYLTSPHIEFIKYETKDLIMNGNYEEVYNQIIKDENRIESLKKIVENHPQEKILIIVSRVEHAEFIHKLLDSKIIQGKTSKKDREQILKEFKYENLDMIIGTAPLVQKGLNIPNLDVIINISGNKGHIMTIQSLGRVLRKSEGKEKAYYYDFHDSHFAMIKHTKERIKA